MTEKPRTEPRHDPTKDLHDAIDVICKYWPHIIRQLQTEPLSAAETLRAHAYDRQGAGSGAVINVPVGDDRYEAIPVTSVEAAAIANIDRHTTTHTGHAAAWIAELYDVAAMFLGARTPKLGPRGVGQLWHGVIRQHPTGWSVHTVNRLFRLADNAVKWFGPPVGAGETTGGVTVGGRTNTAEVCGLCRNPVVGGHDDPIRRINGEPYHKSPCWYTVTTSRGVHPSQRPKPGDQETA